MRRVGYRCAVSLNTLSSLPPRGSEARLYTHLQVREDAIDLFGFADEQELACFKLLTSVNGVGAKLALVLLSDFTADRLALAVAAEDAKALTRSAGWETNSLSGLCWSLRTSSAESAGRRARCWRRYLRPRFEGDARRGARGARCARLQPVGSSARPFGGARRRAG